MTTNNNAPQCFVIGKQAGADMQNAQKYGESGDARATYAMFLAINEGVEFTAIIPGKDGDIGESFGFVIRDMLSIPVQPNGKNDNKKINARYQAVAATLFGLQEADGPTLQRIRRAFTLAVYLDDAIASIKNDDDAALAVECIGLVNRKRVRNGQQVQIAFLSVPEFTLYDPADPRWKLNEQQIVRQQRHTYDPIELDGTKMPGVGVYQSLRELTARAEIASGKRAANRAQKDAGATLKASVSFMSGVLDYLNADEKDAGNEKHEKFAVSLSKAQRLELFLLQSRLAALFAADPLTEEEVNELNKRKAS